MSADLQATIRTLLGEYGCLSTGQIYQLLGAARKWDPANSRQRTIRAVLHRGECHRPAAWHRGDLFKGRKRGRPQTEAVYWLNSCERRPQSLAHDVAVSEIHIALQPEYWREEELRWGGINPDALFFIEPYFYFLELERQRNSFKKTASSVNKARRYLEYLDAADFRRHHAGLKDFFTLFVFAEDVEFRDSADRLRDNAFDAFRRSNITDCRFKLATLADLTQDPHGHIWLSLNGERETL